MMNKAELFRKVGGILAELNDQYQYISENPASLNELELELLSANADFLAEHIKILLKLSTARQESPAASEDRAFTASVVTSKTDFSEPEIVQSGEAQDPEVLSTTELKEQFQGTSADTKGAVPVVEEVFPVQAETPVSQGASFSAEPSVADVPKVRQPEPLPLPVIPEVVVPAVSPEPVIKAEPEVKPQTVATEQAPVRTLNDIISGQKTQDSVSGKFSHQPVKDLKSIVSLNDKLLFIKELFNGYSLAYSEAIEILNRFDSFEAADAFLQSNYAAKNNWSAKEATVEKLYEVLHRRFGS